MPSATPNAYSVPLTPLAQVYVGSSYDPKLVCRSITISATGAIAEIDAPFLNADTPHGYYFMAPITVYIDSSPTPVFRGFIDTSLSELRREQVTFYARSVWSFLQDVRLFTPQQYNVLRADGLTTQANPILYILSDNPYTDEFEAKVWQPAEIVQAIYSRMDTFWQSQTKFWTDSAIQPILPIAQSLYKLGYDALSARPTFTATTVNESPQADIILRETTTIGEAMDMVCEMVPGTQVFEAFSGESTDIYLAYPNSFGGLLAAAGVSGSDWRDTGSNVIDLETEVESGSSVNRVVARGAQASCIVTLMSETAVEGDGGVFLTGLIPDWDLYVAGDTMVDVSGLQGVSKYNYDAECTYAVQGFYKQSVDMVAENPSLGKPGEPDYIKGFEHVGRRYRLPVWFEFADIETSNDIIQDKKTGHAVKVQAFFEMARHAGKSEDETPYDQYKYTWFETKDFVFNQRDKTITFGNVLLTDYIGDHDDQEWVIVPGTRAKLCRVAITLTYSHPAYSVTVDSYLDSGGVLPQFAATAISTGQAFEFSDSSLGYSQISNIGMPFVTNYGETIAIADNRVRKVPLQTPATITYTDFLLAAETGDAPNVYDAAKVISFMDEGDAQANPGNNPTMVTPMVLRNDLQRLRLKCYQTLYRKLRKVRKVTATFNQIVPFARRGMQLAVNYFRGLDTFSGDNIDTVRHDLTTGYTRVTTTNQLANDVIDRSL